MVEYYDEDTPPSFIVSAIILLVMVVAFSAAIFLLSLVNTIDQLNEIFPVVIIGLVLSVSLGFCLYQRLTRWIRYQAMDHMRKSSAQGEI